MHLKIRKIQHKLTQMFIHSNAVLPCLGFALCCSYIKSQRSTSLNSRHDVRVVLCADSRGHRKTHTHNHEFAIRQSCSLIHIKTLTHTHSVTLILPLFCSLTRLCIFLQPPPTHTHTVYLSSPSHTLPYGAKGAQQKQYRYFMAFLPLCTGRWWHFTDNLSALMLL